MFEWFGGKGGKGGKASGPSGSDRAGMDADANISGFMKFFGSDGPKAKPAKDGWSPLPGSGTGAVYDITSEKVFWKGRGEAAEDAKLFKSYHRRAISEAEAYRQRGDVQKALASETIAGYCYRAGTAAFDFAGPEYFVYPEREREMSRGERAGSPPA